MSGGYYHPALLLFSIGYCCDHYGDATLECIFAAEDAINKSAPFYDELKDDLARLITANLIERDGEKYHMTPRGSELYKKSNQVEGNVFVRLHFLENELTHLVSSTIVTHTIELDRQLFESAYRAHYKS